MLKLDNDLLQELGLGGLPDDQKQAMLQYIYETLELRVGTNLANQMTDEQLDEFEKFIDDKGEANQAQALQWLEANLPNYKQVVNEVFEQLKVEILQIAPQLLASAPQQQMGQAPVAPMAAVPSGVPPQAPMQGQGGYGPQNFSQAGAVPYYTAAQSQFYAQQPGAPVPQPAYQPVGMPPAQGYGPQPAMPFQPQAAVPVGAVPAYDPAAGFTPQPPIQQGPAGFGQPLPQPPVQQQPVQQDGQAYQLPTQQPPAGPGI